jgi:hypothetical protein
MAFYLFTVEYCQKSEQGLVVRRGIPLGEVSKRPEIRKMRQGTILELRHRDGKVELTELVQFGVITQQLNDGAPVMEAKPHMHFVLPASLEVSDVPPGTEIWLPYIQ